MFPWQDRVITERDELQDKIDRLMDFLMSPQFNKLDRQNQALLNRQCFFMCEYASILNQRIKMFSDTHNEPSNIGFVKDLTAYVADYKSKSGLTEQPSKII